MSYDIDYESASQQASAANEVCENECRKAQSAAILVTFGLPFRLVSPRVWQATEPYPGHWTHHVVVSGVEELDAELMGWIDASYDFSQGK